VAGTDECLFQRELPEVQLCRQERSMASMESAVKTIAKAVDEIKDGQKENNKLMRDIAVQGTKVDALVKALDVEVADRKHVNDILFTRVQALEQAPVQAANNRQSGLWGNVAAAIIGALMALIILFAGKK
jgi:septal ring factor EnvC (AmiA/AmiB activator)